MNSQGRTVTRRQLLQAAGLVLLAGPSQATTAGARGKTLVCICLRGGLDGLNAVVPYAEQSYYEARPRIAVPPPTEKHGALALDGQFGLHPQLSALLPLYRRQVLGMVHAVGSHHETRSHFEAQDYMGTGVPGDATLDGWLNRYLALGAGDDRPLRAISFSGAVPRALSGAQPVLAIEDLSSFGLKPITEQQTLHDEFEALYGHGDDPLSIAARRALSTVRQVRDRASAAYVPEHGVQYPGAARPLMDVARLIKAGFEVEVAWVEFAGWDTHTGQRGDNSVFHKRLRQLGSGLAAFHADMAERMKDILVLTLTEFGRTVRENGTFGSDHGHGSVMFALGAGVRGGRVHGVWPGLAQSDRFQGRDLAVTTDVRQVLCEVLERHLSVADPAQLFPGFDYQGGLGLLHRPG